VPVSKAQVSSLLLPGTRRTYSAFSRCQDCGQIYWHGAHSSRLRSIIASAERLVGDEDGQRRFGG